MQQQQEDSSDDDDDESLMMEESDDDKEDPPVYILIMQFFATVADNFAFQGFIIFAIILAAVLFGLETVPCLSCDSWVGHHASVCYKGDPLVELLNMAVQYIFLGEVVIKILAVLTRPYRYFFDSSCSPDWWNIFDFTVVALGFANLNEAAVLRLVRMARLLKLVRALPTLQMLVLAMLDSMAAVAYVFILLLLLMYFFGVIGIVLFQFNQSKEAERYFGTLPDSITTLFGIALGGPWTKNIMYPIIYGDDPTLPYPDDLQWTALGWVTFFYFYIYLLVAKATMVNLVIGIIALRMRAARREANLNSQGLGDDNAHDMKTMRRKNIMLGRKKMSFPRKYLIRALLMEPHDSYHMRFLSGQRDMLKAMDKYIMQLILFRKTMEYVCLKPKGPRKEQPQYSFEVLFGHAAPAPPKPSEEELEQQALERKKKKGKNAPAEPSGLVLTWRRLVTERINHHPYSTLPFRSRVPLRMGVLRLDPESLKGPLPLRVLQIVIAHLSNICACISFNFFVLGALLVCVLLAAAIIGVQSVEQYKSDPIVAALDDVVTWAFFTEFVLKIGACGIQPHMYFIYYCDDDHTVWHFDLWNIMDFAVVGGSMYDVEGIAILRLLRLVRILRVVRALPALRQLVSGLVATLIPLFYIFMLLVLYVYIFAVLGVGIFRDNDKLHFGNLGRAVQTMLDASLGSWTDALYVNLEGCWEHEGYPQQFCTFEESKAHGGTAAMFFAVFSFLAFMITMKLVLGVIIFTVRDTAESEYDEVRVNTLLAEGGGNVYVPEDGSHTVVEHTPSSHKRLENQLLKLLHMHKHQVDRARCTHVAPLLEAPSLLKPKVRPLVPWPGNSKDAKAIIARLTSNIRDVDTAKTPRAATPSLKRRASQCSPRNKNLGSPSGSAGMDKLESWKPPAHIPDPVQQRGNGTPTAATQGSALNTTSFSPREGESDAAVGAIDVAVIPAPDTPTLQGAPGLKASPQTIEVSAPPHIHTVDPRPGPDLPASAGPGVYSSFEEPAPQDENFETKIRSVVTSMRAMVGAS